MGELIPSPGLLSLEFLCTWLPHVGAPVIGVSPVWPSIMESSPSIKLPDVGVLMGTPVAVWELDGITILWCEVLGMESEVGRPAPRLLLLDTKEAVLTDSVGDSFLITRWGLAFVFLAEHTGWWAWSKNSNCSFCCCRFCISFSRVACSSSRPSVSC